MKEHWIVEDGKTLFTVINVARQWVLSTYLFAVCLDKFSVQLGTPAQVAVWEICLWKKGLTNCLLMISVFVPSLIGLDCLLTFCCDAEHEHAFCCHKRRVVFFSVKSLNSQALQLFPWIAYVFSLLTKSRISVHCFMLHIKMILYMLRQVAWVYCTVNKLRTTLVQCSVAGRNTMFFVYCMCMCVCQWYCRYKQSRYKCVCVTTMQSQKNVSLYRVFHNCWNKVAASKTFIDDLIHFSLSRLS